jgi:hypothetical protein
MKFVTFQTKRAHLRGDFHRPLETGNGENYVMTKSTETLTQSGLLAVLLQRQRYKSNPFGPASRTPEARACRFLGYPHPATARAHGAKAGRRAAPHLNLSPGQLPCLIKSTPTASSGNRFTTTSGSNIPNGSSQLANAPRVILTSHASWNCSIHSRERDPASLSLIFIASSNRD